MYDHSLYYFHRNCLKAVGVTRADQFAVPTIVIHIPYLPNPNFSGPPAPLENATHRKDRAPA